MTKQIMVRAWEIARAGVDQFGGKASEYFAESLKLAWANYKEGSHANNRLEIIVDRDGGYSQIVVIKNNKVVRTIKRIVNDSSHEYLADTVANTGIKTVDYFFNIDSKRVYRGQQVAN